MPLPSLLAWLLNRQAVLISSVLLNGFSLIYGKEIRRYETPSYDVKGLPRTNNELEHCFGVARVHERRATGRRGAIPGAVVRGSVRLLAVVVATREDVQAADLQPTDYQKWRELRAQLWSREEARRMQFRFRKDPAAYLAALEAQLLE